MSDSEYESSESDSSVELVRPVFVTKRSKAGAVEEADSAKIALSKAEHALRVDAREVRDDFDGVSDGDDKDPENEYAAWRQREAERRDRDRRRMAEHDEQTRESLQR